MIEILMVVSFAAVFLIYVALVGMSERATIRERLRQLAGSDEKQDSDDILLKPLKNRVLIPVLDYLASIIRRISPVGITEEAQKKIDMAGHPWHLQANEFLGLQGMCGILIGIFALLVIPKLHMPPVTTTFMVILAIPFGFFIPEAMVQRIIRERQTKIRKSLPDTIDLLLISVEAGTGFDGAVSKVVEKMKGPLPQEFERVLKEMRFGSNRSKALRDMAKRTGVMEVSTFVAAVYQADQLGVSIAKVLRVQGAEMRKLRSRHAREMGAKLPVKMLLPLILFVFPATMVVIAGPAMLSIMKMLSSWNTH